MAEGKIHNVFPEHCKVVYRYEEITINDRNSLSEHGQDRAVRQRFWHIHSGEVVIDVGAGFGVYTLCALAANASHVYAFESNPNVMRALRANLSKNQPLHAVEKCSACSWRVDDNQYSVDKFVESMSSVPTRVSWLKIDTGDRATNINVLQGARKTIQTYHPNVLIHGTQEDIFALKEYGYSMFLEEGAHEFAVFDKPMI